MTVQQPNTLYPGRPNYTGPTKGLFGMVHHERLAEYSDDIMERVDYINANKPKSEIEIRLHCLVCLPIDRLPAELRAALDNYRAAKENYLAAGEKYQAHWKKYYLAAGEKYRTAGKKHQAAWEKYRAAWEKYQAALEKAQEGILALIKELVPDCPWDGEKLVFEATK